MKILENNKKKLIVLTGPTCSGKSSIALNLSDLIPIEIISADSMLVYKDFNIGILYIIAIISILYQI